MLIHVLNMILKSDIIIYHVLIVKLRSQPLITVAFNIRFEFYINSLKLTELGLNMLPQ